MASNPPTPKAPKKTLVAILGAGAAAMLMTAVPREESGRTVHATVTADGHVALKHISGRQYLAAYKDVLGINTACDGLTRGPDGKPLKGNERFTEAQCDAMLEAELVDSASHVMACTPGLEGHDGPKVASALLAHNIGWPAYCRSSIRARFNAHDYPGGCSRFPLYDKAGGRHLPALKARRNREKFICITGRLPYAA
jgi:lysozyme